MKADADLIAAGLLLDLKTDSKFSLGVAVMFQIMGYVLLDFDDAYGLTELGVFSARYAHVATWELNALLDELAGHLATLSLSGGNFACFLLGANGSLSGADAGRYRERSSWLLRLAPRSRYGASD
jgi:hypothetical protein